MSIDFTRTFEREAQGWSFRRSLEALLLELDTQQSELLQLCLREGRGAWLTLLTAQGGQALLAGNALSGTITALALHGFQVDVLDPGAPRTRFAAFRARAQTPNRVALVEEPRGPYRLVVLEDGLPRTQDELARFEKLLEPEGELVLVADNRLGYKRSLGKKGAFHVPRPFEFARLALAPGSRERTLQGYKRELALGTPTGSTSRTWWPSSARTPRSRSDRWNARTASSSRARRWASFRC
jgi:hypothetical protein